MQGVLLPKEFSLPRQLLIEKCFIFSPELVCSACLKTCHCSRHFTRRVYGRGWVCFEAWACQPCLGRGLLVLLAGSSHSTLPGRGDIPLQK